MANLLAVLLIVALLSVVECCLIVCAMPYCLMRCTRDRNRINGNPGIALAKALGENTALQKFSLRLLQTT